ncbi:MAG: mycothiol system anti-sigma-R factor [Candidatus Nanopelagicales bacterium]
MSCGNPHDTPCAEVDAHLDEYLDRELTNEDVALLEQHFRECPPCSDRLTQAKLIQKLVARACGCQAPDDLRYRVMQRLTEVRNGDVSVTVEETRIFED